jgi:hypothetical protein
MSRLIKGIKPVVVPVPGSVDIFNPEIFLID